MSSKLVLFDSKIVWADSNADSADSKIVSADSKKVRFALLICSALFHFDLFCFLLVTLLFFVTIRFDLV